MKKLLTITLALALTLTLVACGNKANDPSGKGKNTTAAPSLAVVNLTGEWKQTNSNSSTNYHIATINNKTIEVYWKMDDDMKALYWAGSYIAPTSETNEYTWDSVNDKTRTKAALLSSSDDKKTFTHKNGIISYSVTAMGVTKTVELKRVK